MRKSKKESRPKWPVAWGCEDDSVGRMNCHGKIGRLPRGIREELNRRLRQGERGAPLAEWLHGLPETQAALARDLGGQKVTLRNLAEWQRGGFRDWQAKQDRERNIARQFREWAQQPRTHEKLFGPPITEFIMRNRMRERFGREPITREDIPPGENWDIPLKKRAERIECFWKIVGVSPTGADEEKSSIDENEGSVTGPPPAEAG